MLLKLIKIHYKDITKENNLKNLNYVIVYETLAIKVS